MNYIGAHLNITQFNENINALKLKNEGFFVSKCENSIKQKNKILSDELFFLH